MAQGYIKIISRTSKLVGHFFDDWYRELSSFYTLMNADNKLIYIDQEAERKDVDEQDLKDIFLEEQIVLLAFRNREGNEILVSIKYDIYIEEDYDMEQLLRDAEELELKTFVKRRFDRLLDEGTGLGFVYDPVGHSQDYVHIGPI